MFAISRNVFCDLVFIFSLCVCVCVLSKVITSGKITTITKGLMGLILVQSFESI